MNLKLPIISGEKAIKTFEKIGYKVVRIKGSHKRLRDEIDRNHKPLTIPNHKVLKPGLLKKLIRDSNLTIEKFIELLKK
ncbi:hypothetical protein ES703_64844 [subsurface metagenome]